MGRRPLSALISSPRVRAVAAYAFAAVVSLAAGGKLLHLRHMDLHVPLRYSGDALFYETMIKAALESGWYLTIPRLGAPGILEMHDFPMADSFHYLVMKGLGLFSHDWGLVTNVYFLGGFPLIAVAALAVFRHFRIAYGPALAASVLYAFLPSRLLKGESHIFLDIYYQVPLAILVALWVCGDEPPLWVAREGRRWPALDLRRGRSIAAVAVCLLTSGTGIYYAFFCGALMGVGGLWASWIRRSPRNALAGFCLCAIIVTGLAVQAIPWLLYQHRNGPNLQVGHREISDAETYGMKVAQLLLPATGHRLTPLRSIKERYDAETVPLAPEVTSTSLGIVGALGFLSLLGLLMVERRPDRPHDDLLRPLAVLNLIAVLLATLGGFGALFALLVSTAIRTYSRMSVVIAFLALFAAALHLERLGAGRPWRTGIIAAAVLVLGLLDQVTPLMVPRLDLSETAYRHDGELIARVEAIVPPGAMIFQLPYNTFPEGSAPGYVGTMYEGARAYLHSRTLRWSFPAMLNRGFDSWISRVAALPPVNRIEALSDAGFAGILLDRAGYPDRGAAAEKELRAALGQPLTGGDRQRLVFFDLQPYTRRVSAGRSPEERERRRRAVFDSAYFRWGLGFFGPESDSGGPFRWCSETCTLEIDNDTRGTRGVALSARIAAAHAPADLIIDGDLLSERTTIPLAGLPLSKRFDVPPGRHTVRLHSNGRRATTVSDPRTLIFRVENLRFEDVTEQ